MGKQWKQWQTLFWGPLKSLQMVTAAMKLKMLVNWCFWTMVLEKTLESPLDCKEIQPIHPKGDQSWVFSSNTLATWWEELTHLERPWCWKRLRTGGEGDDRGGDGWMASPTQWTWVWVNSGSWWWTGRSGVLQSMRSQRVGHNLATELKWKKLIWKDYGQYNSNYMTFWKRQN